MSKKLIQAAAGAGGEPVHVEDVFTTHLYKGTGTSQTINNGIDLSGEGGLVWLKNRDGNQSHGLFDTERTNGASSFLSTDLGSGGETSDNGASMTFNSNGFSLGSSSYFGGSGSGNAQNYASWTFRKQSGFFDVVTYTGNATSRSISHNLNASVGLLVIRRVDTGGNWWVLDVGTGKRGYFDYINSAFSTANGTYFGDGSTYQAPTSTEFYISSNGNVNQNNGQYVAYLFAAGTDSGSQIFGEDSDKPIIECGSFTTNGNAEFYENIGWEPQWVLIKRTDATYQPWNILDTMRNLRAQDLTAGTDYLRPNTTGAEGNINGSSGEYINSTGFGGDGAGITGSANATFIYVAIRKPMKIPESGTDVLQIKSTSSSASYPLVTDLNNSTSRSDMVLNTQRVNTASLSQPIFIQFLTGIMESTSVSPISVTATSRGLTTANQNSLRSDAPLYYNFNQNPGWLASTVAGSTLYGFKRRPGFFDISTANISFYSASGSHDLGVVPEMIFGKRHDANGDFYVFHKDLTKNTDGKVNQNLKLNSSAGPQTASGNGYYQDISTTSYSTYWWPSTSGKTVHYLFATLDGVSKVGSYTGTGSDLNVDCGFTSGARFILIRRSDASGYWYLYDSVRGIVSGNDPFILLGQTGAETTTTDYVDPLSSGFTVTSSASGSINSNGGAYIFLAIA